MFFIFHLGSTTCTSFIVVCLITYNTLAQALLASFSQTLHLLIMMNNLNWVQTSDLNLLTCGSDDLTYEENINIIKHVFNFIKSSKISCSIITR
jgi:hypothetical protein